MAADLHIHAIPPDRPLSDILPYFWNHLGSRYEFKSYRPVYGWRNFCGRPAERVVHLSPWSVRVRSERTPARRPKPLRLTKRLEANRKSAKRPEPWVPRLWDVEAGYAQRSRDRRQEHAFRVIHGYWEHAPVPLLTTTRRERAAGEFRTFVEGTPCVWIGEVSFLKAALLQDERFIPDPVGTICEIIGDDFPVCTPLLIRRIMACLRGPRVRGYYRTVRGDRRAVEKVKLWLNRHKGWRLLTSGH